MEFVGFEVMDFFQFLNHVLFLTLIKVLDLK